MRRKMNVDVNKGIVFAEVKRSKFEIYIFQISILINDFDYNAHTVHLINGCFHVNHVLFFLYSLIISVNDYGLRIS